jgi:cytochrome c biogenesis protein CcdA
MFILLIIGFLAGVATVLSPCILPILPIMLSGAVGGRSRPYGILLGFVLSFAIFTVFITAIVKSLGIDIDTLRYVAVFILILLGLMLLFPKIQQWINSKVKLPGGSGQQRQGFVGGLFTGATLGLIWTPCAGPILAAVITLAASTEAGLASFMIVISYALGTGLIMLLIILGSRKLLEKIKGLYKHLETIHRIFGVIIILAGVAIAVGYDRKVQAFILDNTPQAWNEFLQNFEENKVVQNALQNLENKEMNYNEHTPAGFESFRKTDFDKSIVDLDQILSGGPGKDGIPALVNPKFISQTQANLDDEILGVVVSVDDDTRFYPYNILVWHEIVNDSINDRDVAVTFCPLCGSAIVFDRKVDGDILEFGVSGWLFESNMVMYDKQTESFWSQARAESIVGEYAGTGLDLVYMQLMRFEELKEKYPQARVLSDDTGYKRDYSFYPYGSYDDNEDMLFPVSISDQRFKSKEVMYVVPYKDKSITFPKDNLQDGQSAFLDIDGIKLTASRDGGEIIIRNGGEPITGYYEMWFSWAIHHQEDGVVWEIK